MDKERKKELMDEYKTRKTLMGVFAFKIAPTGQLYIGASKDVDSMVKSILFQLRMGSYITNRSLQNDYNTHGADAVTTEILEVLEYEKEETPQTDYIKDLELLRQLWLEKTPNSTVLKNRI